jgi:hypothetical protein
MPRMIQEPATRGSQKWLQVVVNQYPELLNDKIRQQLGLSAHETVTWLSPLERDEYAEYQDEAFLEVLSARCNGRPLGSFWPRGGPVWDGLGRTSRGDLLLVEAKSHVSEMVSSCQAKPKSRWLICASLGEAAAFFEADAAGDWLNGYYQYANRLAHLYLFRHINGLKAWLVFVYFVNDVKMHGPESEAKWHEAIGAVHAHLGVASERLAPHVVDLFCDVSSLQTERQSDKHLPIT